MDLFRRLETNQPGIFEHRLSFIPVDATLAGSAGWNRSGTRCPAGMVVKNLHGNFREKAAKKA
jgi:hypothetical protein